MGIEDALSLKLRHQLKKDLLAADEKLVHEIPKVELHVHIEGTLTLERRWKLCQRNGTTLRLVPNGPELKSLEELKAALEAIMPEAGRMNNEQETDIFFESYYQGFQALKTKEDFYDLAMDYFGRVATMNVRYCEPFFDPQGHTSRGVPWNDMMDGFRQAQKEAESRLNVKSKWIMCFLRDQSPESAMEHYKSALPYRDMIVGIGLDSLEGNRPPSLFDEVFTLARQDGFKLTMHCDVDQANTKGHIRQVALVIAGGGCDRIDHGLNAATDPTLVEVIRKRDIGMTLCPWSYMRHTTYDMLGLRIRTLFDAGIKISINSDDPSYMEDTWVLHNMLLVKHLCGFGDKDIVALAKNAVISSWADPAVKQEILEEIESVYSRFCS